MSLHVRMRYRRAGGHVHVRIFTGPDVDHLGCAGEFMERVEEWVNLRRAMPTVDFVCDDDDADRETYDTLLSGVLVTTMDLDTHTGETMELTPAGYVLTLGKGMYLAAEQRYGTGTVQLTIKPAREEASS